MTKTFTFRFFDTENFALHVGFSLDDSASFISFREISSWEDLLVGSNSEAENLRLYKSKSYH